MARASKKRFRRIELALWAIGISLIGVALGATWDRWHYQQQQERAFLATTPPEPRANEPLRKTEVVGPIEPIGPPAPAVAEKAAPTQEKTKREVVLDPTALGRIEIPRLGLRAIVRKGADKQTLARAVGLVPGAAYPGETGNVVLAGHRDTFFRPLRKIRVNDRIRLLVPPNEYEYRVESTRVVSPRETGVLESRGAEELTLVTCHPFYYVGPAPNRFIVSASRIN